MTTQRRDKSPQETDIPQSAPARAWADTRRFISTPSFWFMELAATALAATALLLLSVPPVMAIAVTVMAPILLLLASSVLNLGLAPLKQRNEARQELTETRDRLKPKLGIVGIRKTINMDENLQNADIYIEYVRLVVSNQSNAVAANSSVSLIDVKPRTRHTPTTVAEVTYQTPDAFAGYTEIPFPISLPWSDSNPTSSSTNQSLGPQGEAQVDVLRYSASLSYYAASRGKLIIKQFELPEIEVLFAVRLDSDDCLPYFCVARYLPNAIPLGSIEPLEILHEGHGMPSLEDFREVVPTQVD